jgi:hypothetical protein
MEIGDEMAPKAHPILAVAATAATMISPAKVVQAQLIIHEV